MEQKLENDCVFNITGQCKNNFTYKRGVEFIWNELNELLPSNLNKQQRNEILQDLNLAYEAGKKHFLKKYRENGERYFEHIKETAKITISISRKKTHKEKINLVKRVIIGLLHDIIEDTKIDFHSISNFFSQDEAICVQSISKEKPINFILNKEEKEKIINADIIDNDGNIKESIITRYNKKILETTKKEAYELYRKYILIRNLIFKSGIVDKYGELKNDIDIKKFSNQEKIAYGYYLSAKKVRDEEYFSHMKDIESMEEHIKNIALNNGIELSIDKIKQLALDSLNVKFADRIHNLKTQWNPKNIDKVIRKIKETELYFLDIAKKTNLKAYNEMIKYIKILKEKLLKEDLPMTTRVIVDDILSNI